MPKKDSICKWCGKKFQTYYKGIYCSQSCKSKENFTNNNPQHTEAGRKRMTEQNPQFREDVNKKMKESCKGRIISEEQRKSISETLKEKYRKGILKAVIPNLKGKEHPNWKGGLPKCVDCGKALSAYTVKRCHSCARTGSRNPFWKDGVTKETHIARTKKQYNLWRQAVMTRDSWTCQKCGLEDTTFWVHHIKGFTECKELRYAIDNGITFCEKCHRGFHQKYGFKGNNEKQIKDYLL